MWPHPNMAGPMKLCHGNVGVQRHLDCKVKQCNPNAMSTVLCRLVNCQPQNNISPQNTIVWHIHTPCSLTTNLQSTIYDNYVGGFCILACLISLPPRCLTSSLYSIMCALILDVSVQVMKSCKFLHRVIIIAVKNQSAHVTIFTW